MQEFEALGFIGFFDLNHHDPVDFLQEAPLLCRWRALYMNLKNPKP